MHAAKKHLYLYRYIKFKNLAPQKKNFFKKMRSNKAALHVTKYNGFLEVQNQACPVQKQLRTRLFPLNATARSLNVF